MSTPLETEAPAVDVFISYARADKEIVNKLAETLRSEGFEIWLDDRIHAGARWETLLMATLSAAKAVLVVWSDNSVGRPWVLKEAQFALGAGRLVPVRIDNCEVPQPFTPLQTPMIGDWKAAGPHDALEQVLAGLARLAPPSRVDNVRPGFDSGFLGVDVGLPALPGVAEEFRYLHFSVVMNPARRLPWYVAYNMQPPPGPVPRGNEWMPDPMLPRPFQPRNEDFRDSGFDRGHMIAPSSVSWGTPRQAQLANRQAFFWTNTVPQHPDMNRRWWLAVEQWERAQVTKHAKVIGFSGPVFADDDTHQPQVERQVGRLRVREAFRLPRRFWKVVVVAGRRGALRTAAFALDQDALVKSKPRSKLAPSTFLCTVADVEALTGLDFGKAIRNASQISL
jgi:DNA/RNA endonuclease G (NUC1)